MRNDESPNPKAEAPTATRPSVTALADGWLDPDPEILRGVRAANLAGAMFRYRTPARSVHARFLELEAAGIVHNDAWWGTATMMRGWDDPA